MAKVNHDKRCGSCSVTHQVGPPTSWDPLLSFPLPGSSVERLQAAHIPLEKGKGGGFILASEGAMAVLMEPTSLNREEGLAAGLLGVFLGDLWWGVGGEGGRGGGRMREDA